jgi:outer membrane lipoprotein
MAQGLSAALLLALVVAVGCVRPPADLAGTFPPVTVRDAQAAPRAGERVRWGGEIVTATPAKDETCFEVVSRPLDAQACPRDTDETLGRFLACAAGFYDPAVWAPGRDVTVVGAIEGVETRKVGDFDYPFPRVRADVVHLWPRQEDVVYEPYPGPYWGGYWGPGWGWGWGWGWSHPIRGRR